MGSLAQRQLIYGSGIVIAGLLAYNVVRCLSFLEYSVIPEAYLERIAVMLSALCIPILTGWLSFRWMGASIFLVFSIAFILFVTAITQSPVFLWIILFFGVFAITLSQISQYFEGHIALIHVDYEKMQDKKNNLEVGYKTKGEGISIFFEKYSTYYNLRKLAEEFTKSFSVAELAQKGVDRAMDFIPRGDYAIITFAHGEGKKLPIIAKSQIKTFGKWIPKQGGIFDFWAIKNRKRLIVRDVGEDFRFDIRSSDEKILVRSLVVAPLLHEGRVMGTIGIYSARPDIFSPDDLRLLDAIAILTSSAISNGMLYERTRELAIKDSLTGLFVRRYFYERLIEEHRRSLISKRTLSLIMCDLDHFKETNDTYGHQAGDLMLVQFAQILKDLGKEAVLARYGGEEFSLLLPDTSKEAAVSLAESIRRKVEKTSFQIRREIVTMTVSIGVASLPDDALDFEALVQKADDALYQAKRNGRNKVCESKV